MAIIYMHVEGGVMALVPAYGLLEDEAEAGGVKIAFDDPWKIVDPGGCDAEVTVPQAENESEARAIVQGMIDQVPRGSDVFTILETAA